jgi:hypothetical protein
MTNCPAYSLTKWRAPAIPFTWAWQPWFVLRIAALHVVCCNYCEFLVQHFHWAAIVLRWSIPDVKMSGKNLYPIKNSVTPVV